MTTSLSTEFFSRLPNSANSGRVTIYEAKGFPLVLYANDVPVAALHVRVKGSSDPNAWGSFINLGTRWQAVMPETQEDLEFVLTNLNGYKARVDLNVDGKPINRINVLKSFETLCVNTDVRNQNRSFKLLKVQEP